MAVAVAFAAALVLVPLAAWAARRADFVDRPGVFKVQQVAVPYGGGLACLVAIAAPLAWSRPSLLIPLALACALGIADDRRDLDVRIRLVAEVVIGVVAALVTVEHSAPFIVAAVVLEVVLLNAANLLDGLDGLLASVAIGGLIGFYVVLSGGAATLAAALAGALAAFLLWNRPPARIYLGDGGSYLVGTALAILFLSALDAGAPAASAAALFVGVPVGDTVIAIVRRARVRRPILQGDRGHVYDQLVDRGLRVGTVVVACAVVQLAFTAIGVVVGSLDTVPALIVAGVTIGVVGIAALWVFTSPRTWFTDA